MLSIRMSNLKNLYWTASHHDELEDVFSPTSESETEEATASAELTEQQKSAIRCLRY